MAANSAFSVRRLRIGSGLVLFGFVAAHFLNHALGLVSVAAMESARQGFDAVWRNPPALALFYAALGVHFALALASIYKRRTLRMPAREALQLVLGLGLPVLIIPHVVAVRFGEAFLGEDIGYARVVFGLWGDPAAAIRQSAAILVAWVHGCLGLWFWLRPRDWFIRARPFLYAIAILVPVLSLLGFSTAGKELTAANYAPPRAAISAGEMRLRSDTQYAAYLAFAGAISATLVARLASARRGRGKQVAVAYPDGRSVQVATGSSVLEASRIGGIPHVAVCGGKGRCSTCRVQVLEGLDALPKPSPEEAATLLRIGAPADVRLACQLRPTSALKVVPVLQPGVLISGAEPGARSAGSERHLAVLFCDLRGFTRLTEKRLPFDTVFLLNRYFAAVGEAVEGSGGTVDKFIGDGVMALFGLDGPQDEACAAALLAAARIARAVEALDLALADELGGQRLRVAIGMHTGPAIVGRMGYGRAASLTVVGDTINTASRLEGVAKEHGAELVMSVDLALRGGFSLGGAQRRIIPIRGRADPLDVLIVESARRLDERLAEPA